MFRICYITKQNMLSDICHVISHMFRTCYITCVMLSNITYIMLCDIAYVQNMLYNRTEHVI